MRYHIMAAADLLLPRRCVVCGRRLGVHERSLCAECFADVPFTFNWTYAHNPMADRLNELVQRDVEAAWGAGTSGGGGYPGGDGCPGGLGEQNHPDPHPEPYAYAAALFFYGASSPYRDITRALKYRGDLQTGRMFARMLGDRLRESPLFADVDAVVPVPLHWTRRFSRGYNQAGIIAEEVAARLGSACPGSVCPDASATIPPPVPTVSAQDLSEPSFPDRGVACLPDLLVRRRRTRTQTHLGVEAKSANVSGAFAVNPRGPRTDVAPRHLLIVDDVFTTGSTVNECRKVLRAHFGPNVRISVATLACV